jgi:hypothetical protein
MRGCLDKQVYLREALNLDLNEATRRLLLLLIAR